MEEILKKPPWIRIKIPSGKEFLYVDKILAEFKLHTVCREAKCPNLSYCWSKKEATIMILGDTCTRYCKFCAVKTGNPGGKVDKKEPERVAEAVKKLNLFYVVITSVDRDDLKDGGAEIFKQTIKKIKEKNNNVKVEPLIPDFSGKKESIEKIAEAEPDVIAHNVETTERLTPLIRDKRASYKVSLQVLEEFKKRGFITKSGFMVGLGENEKEILKTIKDLKNVGVDIVTIGQYLQPTRKHYTVKKYYTPEEFLYFKNFAESLGITAISGPFVRSSYNAKEAYLKVLKRRFECSEVQ